MSWINPISAMILRMLWRRLGDILPQVPTTMGASRKLNREGPIRIPANNWNEMEGRPSRLLRRAASLESRITDIKKMVS
jgi:hypothetical protein